MSKKSRNKIIDGYTVITPTRITPPVINNPDLFKVVCTAANVPITMQYYLVLQPMTMYLVEERDSGNQDVLKAEEHLINMAAFKRATELFPEMKSIYNDNLTQAQREFAIATNLMKDAMQRSYMAGRAPFDWDKMPNNIMFLLDQYIYYVHDLHQAICYRIRNITGKSLKTVYNRGHDYTDVGVKKFMIENAYSLAQSDKNRIVLKS